MYDNQSKLFKPITEATQNVADKVENDKQSLRNMLVPLTNELMRSNDQRQDHMLPYYPSEIQRYVDDDSEIKSSTPAKNPIYTFDVDKGFNETDRENLDDMNLLLPSDAYKRGEISNMLLIVMTENRRIGQYLGAASKKTEAEKAIYQSQKETLKRYEERLNQLDKAVKIPKHGDGLKKSNVKLICKRGRPKTKNVVLYKDSNDLIRRLDEHVAAYSAGNTGVHNTIVDILDKLLQIRTIDKHEYDKLITNIFGLYNK